MSEHIFCSSCGTQNEAGQKFCSNCGAALTPGGAAPAKQVKEKKKRGKGCLIAVTAILLLAICGAGYFIMNGRGDDAGSTAQTNSNDGQQAAPANYSVGQDVQVGEVRWKILSVTDEGQTLKSDNQFIDDLTTSARFVRVTFEMENLSKDMLSFAGLDLVDDQNREFTRSSDAISFIENGQECILENLNPNVPKVCQDIYEIPANAIGLKARAGDLKLFGNNEALIDLGLDK